MEISFSLLKKRVESEVNVYLIQVQTIFIKVYRNSKNTHLMQMKFQFALQKSKELEYTLFNIPVNQLMLKAESTTSFASHF